jgi:hypothetical protein
VRLRGGVGGGGGGAAHGWLVWSGAAC